MTLIIGVDPGVSAMGMALLDINKRKKSAEVLNAYVPSVGKTKDYQWYESIKDMCDMLHLLCNYVPRPKHIYCEAPRVMSGTRGRAAAARGDVVHLAHCMGSVAQIANQHNIGFTPIEVINWKGTLDNSIVWSRVKSAIKVSNDTKKRKYFKLKEHSLDAVGVAICGYCDTGMDDIKWFGGK